MPRPSRQMRSHGQSTVAGKPCLWRVSQSRPLEMRLPVRSCCLGAPQSDKELLAAIDGLDPVAISPWQARILESSAPAVAVVGPKSDVMSNAELARFSQPRRFRAINIMPRIDTNVAKASVPQIIDVTVEHQLTLPECSATHSPPSRLRVVQRSTQHNQAR